MSILVTESFVCYLTHLTIQIRAMQHFQHIFKVVCHKLV